jgi:hypothetical protein
MTGRLPLNKIVVESVVSASVADNKRFISGITPVNIKKVGHSPSNLVSPARTPNLKGFES